MLYNKEASRGLALLLFLLLFISLRASATEISVAFGYAKPPFVFAQSKTDIDEKRGIEIEIMREALAYSGYSMRVHYSSNDELILKLKSKAVDAAATIAKSDEEGIYYSDEFVYFWNYVVTQPDDIKRVSSIKDLQGRKVLAWSDAIKDLGSVFEKTTAKMAFYKEISSQEKQTLFFLQKRADTLIIGWNIFSYWAKKYGYDPTKYNQYDIFDARTGYRVGFSNAKLRDDFNKGLAYLKSSGRYDEIYNQLWTEQSEVSLSEEERNYLEQKGVLKLCFDSNRMPYEAKTNAGKLDGISSDYLELFKSRVGFEVTLHPTKSCPETLEAIEKRECDLMLLAKARDECREYLDFTSSYLSSSYVVATKAKQGFVEDFDTIADRKFAITKKYAALDDLKREYPFLEAIEVESLSDGFKKVKEGEVFGYIDSAAIISRKIQQEPGLRISVKLAIKNRLRVATRSDEPLLHSIMQKAVDTITIEDSERIKNKWLALNIERVVDYSLVYNILIVALLIFLFVLYWYKKLQRLNKNIVKNKNFLQSVLDYSSHAIIATDPRGTITLFNRSAQHMLGYSSEELVGKKTPIIFHDKKELEDREEEFSKELGVDLDVGFELFIAKSNYGLENRHEYKFITKNKKTIVVNHSVNALRNSDGDIDGYIGVIEDITQRKINEKKIARYLEIMDENILSSSTDLDGNIIEVSKAFCSLTGYSKEELIGTKHSKLRHPDTQESQYRELWSTIVNNNIYSDEMQNRRKDGSSYWVKVRIFALLDDDDIKIGYLAIRQDITDKKRIEELSITDELTMLYNRRYFNEVLKDELNRAKRERRSISFLMIDVDYFKLYNDNYGHQKGDIVLSKIGEVLNRYSKRAGDFAFRLGGEEFGVIFNEQSEVKALEFATNILKEIEGLKILHAKSLVSDYVTASMGLIYREVDRETTQESIYKEADKNLYRAKESGRNRVEFG